MSESYPESDNSFGSLESGGFAGASFPAGIGAAVSPEIDPNHFSARAISEMHASLRSTLIDKNGLPSEWVEGAEGDLKIMSIAGDRLRAAEDEFRAAQDKLRIGKIECSEIIKQFLSEQWQKKNGHIGAIEGQLNLAKSQKEEMEQQQDKLRRMTETLNSPASTI